MQFNVCPLDEIDFYKAGHYAQYPDNTVEIYSNFTPRSSRSSMKHVIVMGTQMVMQDIHENWQKNFFDLTEEEVLKKLEEYKQFMDVSIYPNAVTTDHIMDVWKLGFLPLEVKAIPEGTMVPVGVPVVTIRNTHPSAYWLVNYLESKLSNSLWKPITSATTAFQYLRTFHKYAKITGANPEFIQFQGHDFSYRGMSGNEDAVSSGLGHLSSFVGTDTVPAIKAANYYGYGNWKRELIGCSVVATEHSVMCAGGEGNEYQTFERLLDKFPTNVLSVVSDTWDYWQVITEFLPRLRNKILTRDGRLVIRPDSGNPIDIICGTAWDTPDLSEYYSLEEAAYHAQSIVVEEARSSTDHGYHGEDKVFKVFKYDKKYYEITVELNWDRYDKKFYYLESHSLLGITEIELTPEQKGSFQCLWETFGGHVNDTGYKVLDTHIGMIYGDSITLERQEEILKRLEAKGFTADNLVLGIGSFTYEYVTRDTYGMAMKATNVVNRINDEGELLSSPIYKNPKTQAGKSFSKTSAKGYLKVVKEGDTLKLIDQLDSLDHTNESDNVLQTIYYNNGFTTTEVKLSEIRDRVKSYL